MILVDPAVMMAKYGLVVVGGGIAGLRTAEEARRAGYDRPIVIIGEEDRYPYDRPPLSKAILTGAAAPDTITLTSRTTLQSSAIDYLCGVKATRLDVAQSQLELCDGTLLSYREMVIATGSAARQPFARAPRGVRTLRDMQDALDLREELSACRRLVVVGAGFLGLEVASSARSLGIDVTVVEAAQRPLAHILGEAGSEACLRLHSSSKVDILCGVSVAGFHGKDTVSAVELSNGAVLPADLVLVAVGARPNTDWLSSSGLDAENGVLCDQDGRAEPSGRVFAVGDVACWTDSDTGQSRRREDWTSAVRQAKKVGAILAGAHSTTAGTEAPYFWSDQHGTKIQVLGEAGNLPFAAIHGSVTEPTLVGVYHDDQDQVRGLLSFGEPRVFARCQGLVTSKATLQQAHQEIDKLLTRTA